MRWFGAVVDLIDTLLLPAHTARPGRMRPAKGAIAEDFGMAITGHAGAYSGALGQMRLRTSGARGSDNEFRSRLK